MPWCIRATYATVTDGWLTFLLFWKCRVNVIAALSSIHTLRQIVLRSWVEGKLTRWSFVREWVFSAQCNSERIKFKQCSVLSSPHANFTHYHIFSIHNHKDIKLQFSLYKPISLDGLKIGFYISLCVSKERSCWLKLSSSIVNAIQIKYLANIGDNYTRKK